MEGEAPQSPPEIKYKLSVSGGARKIPGVKSLSKALNLVPPVNRFVEKHLAKRFVEPANAESWQALHEAWINLAVRAAWNTIHSPQAVEQVDSSDIAAVEAEKFESGVTKLTATAHKKKVTCYVGQPGSAPFSFRPWNLLTPDSAKGEIPVSTSLAYLAQQKDSIPDLPPIVTSAGWNRLVFSAGRVDLQTNDVNATDSHLARHLRDTSVSLDTRFDLTQFSIDDFFNRIEHPTSKQTDLATISPLYPGQEAHWLVTKKDGQFAVMSLSELQETDRTDPAFRSTLGSISSVLAYIDDSWFDKQHTDIDHSLVNAIVTFDLDGEKRIGSIHAGFETNIKNMFTIAKTMVGKQYPNAKGIAIGVIDGGGSSGAVVTKNAKKVDTSTLPPPLVRHEIPMYIGIVPQEYVNRLVDQKS